MASNRGFKLRNKPLVHTEDLDYRKIEVNNSSVFLI